MSPKKKALGVTALIFIYAVIAILGFLVAYFIKTNFMEQKPTQSVVQTTPVPTKSGFQTYESKDQNFSLQYPGNLQAQENAIGFGVKTIELRSADNTDTAYVADIQILTVPKTLARTIGQDFDSFYDMADNSSKKIESPFGEEKRAEIFTKVRNRTINGLRALDYSSVASPNPDNDEPEVGTFVEAGNNLVFFATSPDNRDELEEVLNTFNYQQ